MTVHLVSWFHADAERFKSTYSQTLGDSTSRSHFAVYERCLRVFYASARRWNPDAVLTLVTNLPVEQIFAPETDRVLRRLGVRRAVVANAHETPAGFWARWQNQFYVLDVAQAVLAGAGDAPAPAEDDVVLVLDSDCLVTARVDPAVVEPSGLASLVMHRRADEAENGVTPRELAALAAAYPDSVWGGDAAATAPYLGGEVLAARTDVLRRIVDRADDAFRWAVDRRVEGLPSLNEEAHLLSLAVHTLGLRWQDADFIDRLWTQPWKFRTVRGEDRHLVVWHLPAEKKTGLVRLDAAARNRSGWFWTADPEAWRRRAGEIVGVPGYSLRKAVSDVALLVGARVRHAVRSDR